MKCDKLSYFKLCSIKKGGQEVKCSQNITLTINNTRSIVSRKLTTIPVCKDWITSFKFEYGG